MFMQSRDNEVKWKTTRNSMKRGDNMCWLYCVSVRSGSHAFELKSICCNWYPFDLLLDIIDITLFSMAM